MDAEVKRDIAVAQYDKAMQTAFMSRRRAGRAPHLRRAGRGPVGSGPGRGSAFAPVHLALRHRRVQPVDLLDAQRSLFNTSRPLIAAQLARQQAHIGGTVPGWWLARVRGPKPTTEQPAAIITGETRRPFELLRDRWSLYLT